MTRVFLSYAAEDETTANRLVSRFTGAGTEFFWWQDKEQWGKRFVGEIEDKIGRANLFVILMSPDYLSSPWCRRELDLAMQRENDLPYQFIYVLKIAETNRAESGFLRSYDWLDLTVPLDDEKLNAVSTALHLDRASVPVAGAAAPVRPRAPRPVFRNRVDELNAIVNALATTGGPDLWLVISPPRMGKSWFLRQLQKELTGRVPDCAVRLLDLRKRPADLRVNPTRLLGALLNVDGPASPLSDTAQRAIATEISKRGCPQLYLLDSADLLETKCAADLRSALTGIYQLVKQTGTRTSRLSVVIGSRHHDNWKGLGRNAVSGVRFHQLALTEFGVEVVHQSLTELHRGFGADQLWDYANCLHRLSEGLPALLIRGLEWAEETEFLELDESEGEGTFDAVARPYIRDDLLSVESLLPFGGHNLAEAKELLERTLRVLVAYRLFTQSHLRYHMEADPDFKNALRAAGWSLDDLWKAVSRTALLKRPWEELWQVIHPPIRRLLYRYYYNSDQARWEAHATARRFYKGWIDRNAGKEQPVVLVECLWHEATRMVIEQPSDVPSLLPGVAEALAGDFAKSPIYEPAELSEFVSQRLREDEEFQTILRKYGGLFDEIVERVVVTVAGGA
ncbi:MAG: TIR domain-containing protein [Pseudonocardiales bacterium]|nr:TIR domain-containing protein [Pseudonocardiales bacterium]